MPETNKHFRPLVVLLVLVVTIAALRTSRVVTMPMGVALFTVMLAWPLECALQRRMHRTLSLTLTLLILLLTGVLFGTGLYFCAESVASKAPGYADRLGILWDRASEWAKLKHLPVQPELIDPQKIVAHVLDAAGAVAVGIYDFLGLLFLVAAFLVLALLEVPAFQYKLSHRIGTSTALKLLDASQEMAKNLQLFMLTRTLTSAATGLLTYIYTWALGLELAFVWGVIAFLLNYIPIIGAVFAVIPPTLVAMLAPNAIWLAPFILGGLTIIHFTIGNYVDPQLQGRFLSISPLILFYSIAFWGWVWGVPGALLATPLTVSIAILCRHFEDTRWIYELLATVGHHPAEEAAAPVKVDDKQPPEIVADS